MDKEARLLESTLSSSYATECSGRKGSLMGDELVVVVVDLVVVLLDLMEDMTDAVGNRGASS